MAIYLMAFLFVHIPEFFGQKEPVLMYLVIFTIVFLVGPCKFFLERKLK